MENLKQELLIYKNKIEELTAYNNRLKATLLKSKRGDRNITIAVKTQDKIEFVSAQGIVYCKADNGISEIYLKEGKTLTIPKSLASLEQILEGFSFFRISSTYIINIKFMEAYHPGMNKIELKNGVFLDLSRRKRKDFLRMTGAKD